MSPALSRKVLSSAVLLSIGPFAEAGIFRPDIDVQIYRDYAENRGVFQPGATNVTVHRTDGSVAGVIAVVPDFDPVNDGGYVTMINASFGASVEHVGGGTAAPTFSKRFNDTGVAYSVFGDTYREVASIAPASGFDFKIMRYSKIFIDAAPAPLMTDTAKIAAMTGRQITRVGGGSQQIATGVDSQIYPYPDGDNYGWLSGGFNRVDKVSTKTINEAVGGVNAAYTGYTLTVSIKAAPDATLEIGTLGGDSGSPVFAWNSTSGRYELIAFNSAGSSGDSGYGKESYLRTAPLWAVAQMNSYDDPKVVDTAGGVIAMSAADATGLGTLTQGATVWNFHGLADGVTSAAATNAQLDAGKNLIFSGAGNILRLGAASVDLGAGSMTFTGGGTYTLDDGGVNTRRLNTAGYIVDAGTTLISKITGSAGDDWRKIGAGTLRIEGSGTNGADLSLGEGLVELNRDGGVAVANVLITSGRGTVRMIGDNQISGAVAFGRRGGTLDLYGHNFTRDVVYAMDSGAMLTNTAANTTSTFTRTGSGSGVEQTFRGGFSDGGSLAAGLLQVVIAPTTAAGAVLTLTGVSNNAGGYAINGGEVVLRGFGTPHAGATNGNQPGEAFPDDRTYAGISTGTITVASGAKFTLADHAALNGNVAVGAGGTFAFTESLFKASAESVESGPVGTPSAALYGHQSGTVTLTGATAAMVATISGNTDQTVVYSRDITGSGSFTKNGVGRLTLSGANTFSGTKTLNGGTLLGTSLAGLGDTTVNRWNVTSSSAVIGATGATAAAVKAGLAPGSTGTLALSGVTPDAAPDMTGYAGLFLGAIGDVAVGAAGTTDTLTAWNGGGWNLGGGGGTLTMNLKLSGAGTLTIGNGRNFGTVVLTNGNNSTANGGAAFTGAIVVNGGVDLRLSAGAAGAAGGALTINYGGSLTLASGGNSLFGIVSAGSTGVLAVSGADANDYDFAGRGLHNAALGADGVATYTGTLSPGVAGYKFGGTGALTVSSVLSGVRTLEADGQGSTGGVTTLSGSNTFTGGVTVRGGVLNGITGSHTLKLGSDTAFGAANPVMLNDGGRIDLNGRITTFAALAGTAGSGLINSSASVATLTINQATSTTFAGVIGGTGAIHLVKAGAGTLVLTGSNSASGYTIAAGTLQVGNGGSIGEIGPGAVQNDATLDFNRSDFYQITNALSGSGTVLKRGAGTLALTGASAFTGTTRVAQGTLQLDAPAGSNALSGRIELTGGELAWGGENQIADASTITLTGTGAIGGGGIVETVAAVSITGTATKLSLGSDSRFTVTGALAITGNNGATGNTFSLGVGSGNTLLTVGSLALDNAFYQLGQAASDNNAILTLNGGFTGNGAASLNAVGVTGAGVRQLKLTSGNHDFNIASGTTTINAEIAGAGGVVKSGTGTLVISSVSGGKTHSYSGGTTVNAGTLIAGSDAAFGTGAVTVNSGGVLNTGASGAGRTLTNALAINAGGTLKGFGTLNGAVTVASGGILAPGSSPGTLTFGGGVTLSAGAIYVWEITGSAPSAAGTDFDRAVITAGTFAVDAGATLKISAAGVNYTGAFWDGAHTFTFLAKSGTGTITGAFGIVDTTLAGGFAAQGSWSVSANAGELQANWTPTAVPEPSAHGLCGAGALVAAALVRRRKRAKVV